MVRHLLRLVWNRKRSTALVMLEIAVAFLVVFAVAAAGVRYAYNWSQPLGFEWRDVWMVEIDTSTTTDDTWTEEQVLAFRRLVHEAATLPRVVAAAGAMVTPYDLSASEGSASYGGRRTTSLVGEVTDDFARVMGLRVVAGRWFDRSDDAAAVPPVVINRHLARELFGDEDPVGKVIERYGEKRVIGVVEEFRQHGELSPPVGYTFVRVPLDGSTEARPPRRLLLAMAPGTPAAHERALLAGLRPIVPEWSFEVRPLARERDRRLRLALAPLVVGGLVGTSLLLMVALGLLGVLWQNVTRRTRELGLRRAVGASRGAVHRQVLLELALLTTLALVPPVLLVLQLPLLGWALPPAVFAGALAVSLATIYGLALLCGVYPSRIATQLPPAEALRWE